MAKTPTDEGLQKVGATMSQIPTYVTAVPNGTEKVNIFSTTSNVFASSQKKLSLILSPPSNRVST